MKKFLLWLPRIVVAIILLQTLAYKFGLGGQESLQVSKNLFTKVAFGGIDESVFRIGSGIAELIFSILILIPRSVFLGSLGAMAMMVAALFFHITSIGFEGDDSMLTGMAIVTLVCALIAFRKALPNPFLRR